MKLKSHPKKKKLQGYITDMNGKPLRTMDAICRAYHKEGMRIPKKGLMWTKNFTPPTKPLANIS